MHSHSAREAARPPTARSRLAPERVTDAVLAWDDAPQALLRPHTKLVFAHEG